VKTGLFGLRSSFVPIRDASELDDGTIRVTVDKEKVKDAPHVEAGEELSAEEERRLYEHYGRSGYGEWLGEDQTTALDRPTEAAAADDRAGDAAAAEGAPAPGDEVPVVVGVRLRRYVVVAEPPPDVG
jgi:hypothetical protein